MRSILTQSKELYNLVFASLVCQIKPFSNLLVYIAKGRINGDRFDFENNLLLYIIYSILHVLCQRKIGEKRFSYLKDV